MPPRVVRLAFPVGARSAAQGKGISSNSRGAARGSIAFRLSIKYFDTAEFRAPSASMESGLLVLFV